MIIIIQQKKIMRINIKLHLLIFLLVSVYNFQLRDVFYFDNTLTKEAIIKDVDTTSFSTLTIPQFPSIPNLKSGYLPVADNSQSWIGFTMFPCQQNPQKYLQNPFLFWIDDFGYSSQISAFFQTGRLLFKGKNDQNKFIIQENQNSLDNFFNVVYLDLVGTGLSYTKSPGDVALDDSTSINYLKNAMNAFFAGINVNPSTATIFIAGRSYGARYAVQLVNYYSVNKINIVNGLVLINAHINPSSVVKELAQFSYNLGLLDFQERKIAEQYALMSNKYLRDNNNAECLNSYVKLLKYIIKRSGVNRYNYLGSSYIPHDLLDQFFNSAEAKKGFNLLADTYQSITSDYVSLIKDSFTKNSLTSLNTLISANKKILIIQGQTDVEYNPLSSLDWVQTLPINGWKEKIFSLRKSNNVTIGHEKSIDRTKLIFYDKSGRFLKNNELTRDLFKQLLV